MLTRVARWFAVMNGVPSVAISSCEKAPPLCVTVIAACASRKVAGVANTVSNGAVVGLRRRHLYGNTRHSVLSVTVQVAGPGGGRGGVGVGHRIPQLGRVAFEECPTVITELGVKPPITVNANTVSEIRLRYATVEMFIGKVLRAVVYSQSEYVRILVIRSDNVYIITFG